MFSGYNVQLVVTVKLQEAVGNFYGILHVGISMSDVTTDVYIMETGPGETDRAGVCMGELRSDKYIP